MKSVRKISFAVCITLIFFATLSGCSNTAGNMADDLSQTTEASITEITSQYTEVSSSTEVTVIDSEKARAVLMAFENSATKHIKGSYSSIYYTGQTDGPTVFEMWIKSGRIRLDEYRDGALYRTLYSIDGTAKNYMYSSGNTIDSIMPLGYYTSLFAQDITKAESLGTDESGGVAIFRFVVDGFYKLETAQSGYYVTEIIYYVDNTKIISHIVFGRDSTGEKPEQLNTVTQTLDIVEIGIEIDDTIFDPPF
jgi:hypothetical protein